MAVVERYPIDIKTKALESPNSGRMELADLPKFLFSIILSP